MWPFVVLTLVIGYLLGDLNGAVWVSHWMKDDVRTHGSGNAGLTNFIRSYGAHYALLVIAVDALKAVAACLIGGFLLKPYGLQLEGKALGGLAVMLGHVFPVFLHFRGGKGILSGFFVALMLDWRIALLILGVFAVAYFATRYVSLGSVLASAAFGAGFVLFHYDNLTVLLCGLAMGLLAIFMHRQNIARLLKGEESKTDLFKK
jgi:glycerol-3-phosphate acyltransferase PlsY